MSNECNWSPTAYRREHRWVPWRLYLFQHRWFPWWVRKAWQFLTLYNARKRRSSGIDASSRE